MAARVRRKKAEVEAAAEAAGAGATAPVQLSLIEAEAQALAPGGERRGAGRPPGALNRRTSEMIAYLESLGMEPPMLQLARTAGLDTRTLARALRCSIADAWDRQQAARIALLPYWHQRLPLALDVQGVAPVPLILGVSLGEAGGSDGGDGGARPATVLDLLDGEGGDATAAGSESEQYQGVGDGGAATVGQGASDDAG